MNNHLKNHQLLLLHFVLKEMQLCVALSNVSKIIPLVFLEPVPNSPKYIVGLMNMSGKSIPIIDLAIRLGMPQYTPYSIDVPILLCQDEQTEAGLVVDKIIGLATVDSASLQMQHAFNQATSFFIASIPIQNELSLLVNIPSILNNNIMHTGQLSDRDQ